MKPLSPPVPLAVPGLGRPLQLHLHGEQDQFVSRRIRAEGIWEPFETALMMRLLHRGDVFVDVGANIGYFSVLAASVVGDTGRVIAFEPDPENFQLLQANIELNAQQHCITAVEAALSEADGAGLLYLSEDNLGDHQVYAADETRASVPVTLYQGSDYLGSLIQRIDVLKIDTQGSEYRVIAGLLPLLSQLQRCPRIIIELTPHSLREAGASGRQLIEALATLQQPMWIIDHIEGQVAASSAEALALWCDNWDTVAEARGFMNILVGALD